MRQIERAKVLHDLIASMLGLYSIVEDGDFNRKIHDLDGVIIRIAVQTIECGIFVQQYMNNTGGQIEMFTLILPLFDNQLLAAD